jgi:hypothetical protein
MASYSNFSAEHHVQNQIRFFRLRVRYFRRPHPFVHRNEYLHADQLQHWVLRQHGDLSRAVRLLSVAPVGRNALPAAERKDAQPEFAEATPRVVVRLEGTSRPEGEMRAAAQGVVRHLLEEVLLQVVALQQAAALQ